MEYKKYTEPGDLDIFDLTESSLIAAPQTLSPARRKRRLLARALKGIDRMSCMSLKIFDFYTCILLMTHTEQAGLDSGATMEAVRNENACNPIVRSVARSYISVAKRYKLYNVDNNLT